MNQVVQWLKSNVPIIVFSVITLASVIVLPLVASGMNQSVRDDATARARVMSDLGRIEQTQISIPGRPPGESQSGVVNERLLEQFRRHVEQTQADAQTVLAEAIAHNRRGRSVLMEELFPEPPRDQREILPRLFHERLMQAYAELLAEVGIGMPPSEARLEDELRRRETQFRTQVLRRDADQPLTADEQEQLEEQLRSLRLLRYREVAESIKYYLDPATLNLPEFDSTRRYTLNELFEWQWKYWVHSDILGALAAANEPYGSVIRAPIKRVVDMVVSASPAVARRDAARPMPIDPRTDIRPDYSVSLTGRQSNQFYDVRYVDLNLIVASDRVYEVIDAISTFNFMTVIDSEVREADPYAAVRAGFFFGSDPIVRLQLRVETVWFREWTSERMPMETLQALGIQRVDRQPGA